MYVCSYQGTALVVTPLVGREPGAEQGDGRDFREEDRGSNGLNCSGCLAAWLTGSRVPVVSTPSAEITSVCYHAWPHLFY